MQPQTCYIICASPRSGSWLLAEALENTNLAGRPREYFLREHMQIYAGTEDVPDVEEYLRIIMDNSTSTNGVFGMKFVWNQFSDFLKRMQQNNVIDYMQVNAKLSRLCPELKYIKITRQDKIRQAISLLKAVQTNVWWSRDQSSSLEKKEVFDLKTIEHRNIKEQAAATFDVSKIDFMLAQIDMFESQWAQYFMALDVHPHEVVYEDLVQNYEQNIINILNYLAIDFPNNVQFGPRCFKRQSNQESDDWLESYYLLKGQ